MFSETCAGRHVPLAVFVVLEPTIVYEMCTGTYLQLSPRATVLACDDAVNGSLQI